MKRRLITALMAVVCSCLCNMSKADVLVLNPNNDSQVYTSEPDLAHNDSGLSVGYYNDVIARSYLMFDLSPIPAGQSIVSAVLNLNTGFYTTEPPVVGSYYLQDDSWSESTLTWNNAPINFNTPATDTQLVNIDEVSWTVSSDVSHAYGDDDIYSTVLKLYNEIPGTATSFWSKDVGITDLLPYLTVEYQPIPEPTTFVILGLGGLILKKRKS